MHFTIYSASNTLHIATAIYVSAMVMDVSSIFEQIDAFINMKDIVGSVRKLNIEKALIRSIKLHANIVK